VRTKKLAATTVALAGLVTTASCGGSSEATAQDIDLSGPVRDVVVDTDLAADDLVALAFLLESPQVDVRAITVSGTGEVRCPAGLEVARGVLALTGHDDIPVACGTSTPLPGGHQFPAEWRYSAAAAWGLDLPEDAAPDQETTGVDLLAQSLTRRTTLLALGSLTNVAAAFEADPSLAGRVRDVVLMGGAVDVGGNVYLDGVEAPTAEWNVYVDPQAAQEVFSSGAPATMVGLDATNEAPISGDFVGRLEETVESEAGRMAADVLAGNPLVDSGEASFWDPLAAAVVIAPELATTEEMPIDVVVDGEESGRTIESANGKTVSVAVDTDAVALEALLLQTLR
jgi:pyrimidine-specific ribonucleoside hydrolase